MMNLLALDLTNLYLCITKFIFFSNNNQRQSTKLLKIWFVSECDWGLSLISQFIDQLYRWILH